MCEGVSKQISDSKKSTAPGPPPPPPPVLKFLDPPLMTTCNIIMFTCLMIYLAYSKTNLEVCNYTYLYKYMYITGAKPALGLNCMIPYINLIFIHVYGVIQFGPNKGLDPVMYILLFKIQAKGLNMVCRCNKNNNMI